MIKAEVPKGKKAGSYLGRAAVRATGSFNIQTAQGVIQGISHQYCKVVQRSDGYGYSQRGTIAKPVTASPLPLCLPAINGGVSRGI